MSISCFEEAKREMDTVDWHVYIFTFSHDAGLQKQLESVDTKSLWGASTSGVVKFLRRLRHDYVS